MTIATRSRLSVMMFLEFFVWGIFYVTMGTYLGQIGFKGTEIGFAYSIMAWAAIISPFFIGMVADRFFAGQKVLGVMHLLGAGFLYLASHNTSPNLFYACFFGYSLCFMSTLALVNAISFHQMRDPGKEFPGIRVLGTIGWIIAGFLLGLLAWIGKKGVSLEQDSAQITGFFGWIKSLGLSFETLKMIETTVIPMKIGVIVSLILGVYSFTLPDTPPKGAGARVTASDILGLKSLSLMKQPSFAIFVICSLLICIPLSFYYGFANPFLNELGVEKAALKQTLGQVSETLFMLVMPLFFARLGVKKMLLVGMLAWTARYFLFAFGDNHTLVWMLYGGILLHGVCFDFFFVTGQIFVDKKAPPEIRASAQGFITLVTYGVGMVIGSNIAGSVVEKYATPDKLHLWKSIWMVPGIMAAVVAVIFALLFRDKGQAESGPQKREVEMAAKR